MKHNQYGFSPFIIIFGLLIVGVIGFGGWKVYESNNENDPGQQQPLSKTIVETKEKEPVAESKVTVPAGWKQYSDKESGISFYHPGQWAKDDMKIGIFEADQAISSGFGTPDGVVYDSMAKTWDAYIHYGEAEQRKIESVETDEFALKSTTISASNFPVAYRKIGHASVVTHDIFLIANDKAVRLRLPMINGSDNQDWEKQLTEQKQAVPELLRTISID